MTKVTRGTAQALPGGWGRPVQTITFSDLTPTEREDARLMAICNFLELSWVAGIMEQHDCTFTEARRIFYKKH